MFVKKDNDFLTIKGFAQGAECESGLPVVECRQQRSCRNEDTKQ
jgi:hypothetical protein